MADKQHDGTNPAGERSGVSKLTEIDVLAIRASAEDAAVLAARFNVHKGHIWNIRAGKSWKHILPPDRISAEDHLKG
jgi:hypothetical protein